MGQKFTRSRQKERERRREEERLCREIDQSLKEGMLLADKLTAEIFGKPFKSTQILTNSQLNK